MNPLVEQVIEATAKVCDAAYGGVARNCAAAIRAIDRSQFDPAIRDEKNICYTLCDKHMGMSFTMELGYAVPFRMVCPVCEPSIREALRRPHG